MANFIFKKKHKFLSLSLKKYVLLIFGASWFVKCTSSVEVCQCWVHVLTLEGVSVHAPSTDTPRDVTGVKASFLKKQTKHCHNLHLATCSNLFGLIPELWDYDGCSITTALRCPSYIFKTFWRTSIDWTCGRVNCKQPSQTPQKHDDKTADIHLHLTNVKWLCGIC